MLLKFLQFYLWLPVFLISIFIYVLEVFIQRIFNYKDRFPYLRKGACRQTGDCCLAIGMGAPRLMRESTLWRGFLNTYFSTVFNFKYLGIEKKLLVYECRHLQNKKCSIYPFRPNLCRRFPQLSFKSPIQLHKNCGYYFIKKEEEGGFWDVMEQKKRDSFRV